MIIYSAPITHFLEVAKSPKILVSEVFKNLLDKFGISVGENEQRSWHNSLPEVACLLKKIKKDKRWILIEFNIPTTKQRVDFIILGKNKNGYPSAWLLELKQWSSVQEIEWNEFRVGKYTDSHPSYQAWDYLNRLTHEMSLMNKVDLKSSAYLHNLDDPKSPLFKNTYADVLKAAFLYSKLSKKKLIDKIDRHTIIRDGAEAFAKFKSAHWAPSKYFQQIISEELQDLKLVGTQKEIYEKIKRFMMNRKHSQKLTFIISGDPGSGKTIVAFKLLMLMVQQFVIKIQLVIPGQEVRDAFKFVLRKKTLSTWISGASLHHQNTAAIIDEAHKAIGRNTGIVNYKNMYQKLRFAIIFIDDDQVINRKGVTEKQITKIANDNGHTVYNYKIEENFRHLGERALIDWIDCIFYKRKTRSRELEYSQINYVNKFSQFKLRGYENDDAFVKAYLNLRSKINSTRIASLWHAEFYVGPSNIEGEIPATVPIGKYKFIWNPNQEWWSHISPKDKKTYSEKVKSFVNFRRNFLIGKPNFFIWVILIMYKVLNLTIFLFIFLKFLLLKKMN